MTTTEHPITRSELREELSHYATKADLREELSRYATKADLKEELSYYATKADLIELKAEVAELRAELYQSLHRMESRLLRWMAGWTMGGMVGITGLVLAAVRVAGN